MKETVIMTSMRLTQRIVFASLAILGIGLKLNAQQNHDTGKFLEEEIAEHRKDLVEFRFKNKTVFDTLPRVNLKETSFQLYDQAQKLADEGRSSHTSNNLEEAEAKLQTSLSLYEDDFVRSDYALTLVEEKKYVEALPNCVEAALVYHFKPLYSGIHHFVEEYPLPLPTLAYELVQVGDLKRGAIIYNFARLKLQKDIKRNISMFMSNSKTDSLTINEKLRLPLPSLELDPEKTDKKTLDENCSILFFIVSEMNYGEKSRQFPKSYEILPHRLATQMVESAYKANPDSGILNFYKGYVELQKRGLMYNEVVKKGRPINDILVSVKQEQSWYQAAIKLAGAGSKLGVIAKEYFDASELSRIETEKVIEERKRNP